MKQSTETRPKVTVAILFLGLTAAAFATAADLNVPADYPTIQAAVDAANTNDTIHITPGVYTGQVVVVRKKLTLAGAPGVVMRATPGMPASLQPYDFYTVPLLGVALSEVTIQGIAFEGEHLTNGYPYLVAGIIYSGSSGTIENCSISGFGQLDYFAGSGIIAANNTTLGTGPVAVQILRCTFQDNAQSILVKGADATADRLLPRLSFTIEGNTITGLGPTTNGTQTGIFIAPGATGEVRYNTITDYAFTGSGADWSAGILAADWLWLIFGQTPPAPLLPVTYQGNTFRNNQLHLAMLYDNGSQIVGNTFAVGLGYRAGGLYVSGRNTLIATNTFSDMPTGVVMMGDDPDFPQGAAGIATNSALNNNRFCNVTNPIVIEPLATNITEQGTLMCPFPPPPLAIAPAVLLSWPGEDDDWTVESALSVDGPWAASDATPFMQDGRHSIAVPTDGELRFFRLATH
jgi:Right handed beta helix region